MSFICIMYVRKGSSSCSRQQSEIMQASGPQIEQIKDCLLVYFVQNQFQRSITPDALGEARARTTNSTLTSDLWRLATAAAARSPW